MIDTLLIAIKESSKLMGFLIVLFGGIGFFAVLAYNVDKNYGILPAIPCFLAVPWFALIWCRFIIGD